MLETCQNKKWHNANAMCHLGRNGAFSGALVGAARDFQQMVAELGLIRSVDRIQGTAEHHFIEFLDHLTGAEFAQIAPLAA